jgi:hypothetical protein
MRSIEDRTYTTKNIPAILLPDEVAAGRVVAAIMTTLGESPEALRGFLHGLDMAVSFTAMSIERALDAGTITVDEEDPVFIAMERMVQLVATLERSREYAAAVAVGRRMAPYDEF